VRINFLVIGKYKGDEELLSPPLVVEVAGQPALIPIVVQAISRTFSLTKAPGTLAM
jgi:hypothetical protein